MADSEEKTPGYDDEGVPPVADHRSDAAVFAHSLMEQVSSEDIHAMVYVQRDMLSRFEKTNEMLINFNLLSTARYDVTVKEFQKHTQLLFEMKKDLDGVFKRIRMLKQRLGKIYPEAFAACSSVYVMSEAGNDDDDSEEERIVQVSGEAADTRDISTSTTELKTASPPLVTVTEPHKEPETELLVDISDS
ncbi:kxDL motif-containing protein 1 [Aplysia californica]|uniref:KxDL motif-containing protein 1 n=1 Tax=Aplysia californica TaxID=6500 RepID=A0ABM0JIE1_APLCA|nr:kxDL motif-containing protein 1 [Aplysia californica]XP_005094345.1 kxDL motif-containing protein 1 [Aplysia californica]XP_005094346.1 kxDL motif-containing protein 1 [Aplysia californica]XP_035824632.1 kxDL motif-containing protein 1 [Aplysia californica]XP_035824633.1 kxDL motif-containing protein 1 [Aplysia californica]XP_035824634.1 kxDL motif-containing protein 1 [Aplysia californica]XP_035824635.1 kxDL motif-containing protein 1 [Aplysia californica]